MDEINKSLTTIETNLKKLGKQYKSGQHVLIIDALNALKKVNHLTNRSSRAADSCPKCGKPLIMGVCETGCGYIPPPA